MSYRKEFKHNSSNVWEAVGIDEKLLKETTDMVFRMFKELSRPSMFIEAMEEAVVERSELLRPMLIIVAGAVAKQQHEIQEKMAMVSALGDVLNDLVTGLKSDGESESEPEQKETVENKDNLH